MQWREFLGNRGVKAQLRGLIDGGRLPHALLLEGPRGSGRRTLARLVAAAAVCGAAQGRPCGVCPACHKALSGIHPDIEMLGEEEGRSFKIEAVRDLRDRAYVRPNEAPRRVMILAGADAMTVPAQNAILKILEEPPATLLFILTCENRALLLPTVRSRTLTLTLHGVEEAEGLPFLKARLPQAQESSLKKALALYDGCLGRALAALSEEDLGRITDLAEEIALATAAPKEWELLTALAPLDQKDKALTDDVLAALTLVFRDALAASQGAQIPSSAADKLARALTPTRLAALVEAVDGLRQARRRNINQTLLLTLLCARLRAAAGRE